VFPVDTGDENAEVTSEHSVQIDFHESIRGFLDYESEFGRDDMYSHIVSGGVEFRW
jgi:hypothetical protein